MPASRYTVEETDRALMELAVCGGNSCAAHRRLAAKGLRVSADQLRKWRNKTHPDRYADIQKLYAAQVEDTIVAEARETAVLAAEVEREALQASLAQLKNGTAKDPAGMARNAATVKGINVDKMLTLDGRPTQIKQDKSITELLRGLEAAGVLRRVQPGEKALTLGEADFKEIEAAIEEVEQKEKHP